MYDFDEPWNGPNNRQLGVTLECMRCPKQRDYEKEQPLTNYTAVVGPRTMWPGDQGVSTDDIPDGAANTILIAETADSGIHWMEPRDLHVLQMPPQINPRAGQGISSHHSGGATAVFADGSVRFLSDEVSPEVLKALLSRNGNEPIGQDDL